MKSSLIWAVTAFACGLLISTSEADNGGLFDEEDHSRFARASPLRWGKRVSNNILRWGKREAAEHPRERREAPLRWGKRDVGAAEDAVVPHMRFSLDKRAPLRWGKLDIEEDKRAPLRWGKREMSVEEKRTAADILEELAKRAPLRWGKRSPVRFGKRGPSRFGKRGPSRFGKRVSVGDDVEDELMQFLKDEYSETAGGDLLPVEN